MTASPAGRLREEPRPLRVAVVGNPNTGKTTLFNALTGLRRKVGNYPGVTVERTIGVSESAAGRLELVDLPGTYSLSAGSPDELIAVEVLAGALPGEPPLDGVVVVVDATNLRRNLFLVTQVLALELPVVVALNMSDLAHSRGVEIDVGRLSERLGVPVVETVASRGEGLPRLVQALWSCRDRAGVAADPCRPPGLAEAVDQLRLGLGGAGGSLTRPILERALLDVGGPAEAQVAQLSGGRGEAILATVRDRFADGGDVGATEARERYRRIDELLAGVERRRSLPLVADRIDRVVHHPLAGTLILLGLLTVVFQSVFAWAAPLVELIDAGVSAVGRGVAAVLPDGALESLLVDGVVAGVGAVVVFLPQVVILFLFLVVLEDSGYMARVAFLLDRLMRACGLSGHSVIPMLSSFACAVPGIMATRVISDRRDRVATILAAPFMTCSARLPVYGLLIGAFVPAVPLAGGLLGLQGLTLLGLYLLGIGSGVLAALVAKRTVLAGPPPPFLLELPPYRWPQPRSVVTEVWQRARAFLLRAGTFIFAASLVVWALAYFPHSESIEQRYETARADAAAQLEGAELEEALARLDTAESSAQLENSLLGRGGRWLEPLCRPLGWDWRITAAVVASFPAREVVVAALATTTAVGSGDEDTTSLAERLRTVERADGSPLLTAPVALGLMVFVALCLQCVSTMAVMARESGSWRWPVAAWLVMTGLAWLAAFVTVRVAALWF